MKEQDVQKTLDINKIPAILFSIVFEAVLTSYQVNTAKLTEFKHYFELQNTDLLYWESTFSVESNELEKEPFNLVIKLSHSCTWRLTIERNNGSLPFTCILKNEIFENSYDSELLKKEVTRVVNLLIAKMVRWKKW